MSKTKQAAFEATDYNVRIIDNGNGTYGLGHVSRFRLNKGSGDCCGTWVSGNKAKLVRLLTTGKFVEDKR